MVMKKKNYSVDGIYYKFICSVHDDIKSMLKKMDEMIDVAKSMGISMEDGLHNKKQKIEELEKEKDRLKEKNKKLREQIKKLKEKK